MFVVVIITVFVVVIITVFVVIITVFVVVIITDCLLLSSLTVFAVVTVSGDQSTAAASAISGRGIDEMRFIHEDGM